MLHKVLSVGILTGCESDKHLSENILIELKNIGIFAHYITLKQNDIMKSYEFVNIHIDTNKDDLILAVGDRTEQIGGVLAAFQNKIPIGHLYAGDHNTISTFDDIHRHSISLYSNIQFCSCNESRVNVVNLMRSAGLVPNANVVGATHFDEMNLEKIKNNKYGLQTHTPYILILINSETKGNDDKLIEETLLKLKQFYPYDHICKFNFNIAKGNSDSEDIETKLFTEIMKNTDSEINIIRDNRQNHEFFLSLIANSYIFITNSSAAIYEAPMLLNKEDIIMVGNRNRERTQIPIQSHHGNASFRVATLIKAFLEEKI